MYNLRGKKLLQQYVKAKTVTLRALGQPVKIQTTEEF